MIGISLTFPAGRYHATPWGRHVNEGAVEWPPSPWRLLRALIATWKRTLPGLPQEQVEPILRTLAGSLPEFHLPPASTGHTRHYMPWHKNWKPPAPINRTLVFDTFVALSKTAPLIIRWPDASLDGDQRNTLDAILHNLSTLGRAESWCEATLLPGEEAVAVAGCATALPRNGHAPGADREIVHLLCPDPDAAFESGMFVDQSKRKPKRTSPPYDPDWHICAETLWLHKERWSDPPGSRWVQFTRPRDCFKIEPTRARRPRLNWALAPQVVRFALDSPAMVDPPCESACAAPQVVRFALDSPVLPLVTDTLPVAEAARAALQCLYGEAGRGRARDRRSLDRCVSAHVYGTAGQGADTEQERSVIFSGHEPSGAKCEGHRHAYFLPTDEDGDRRLDHITLVARDGFGPEEMRAIHRLREIRPRGRDNDSHPLRVLLLGYGRLDKYQPQPLKPSREWRSATPYIATRHAKTRGRERIDLLSIDDRSRFLQDDLRRQLNEVRKIGAAEIEQIIPALDSSAFRIADRWRPIQFKRFRSKRGDDGGRRLAGAFRIKFHDDINGPLALGHSAHFGMGLFLPMP